MLKEFLAIVSSFVFLIPSPFLKDTIGKIVFSLEQKEERIAGSIDKCPKYLGVILKDIIF